MQGKGKLQKPVVLAMDSFFSSESIALSLLPDIRVVMSTKAGSSPAFVAGERNLHNGKYHIMSKGNLVATAFRDSEILCNITTQFVPVPHHATREDRTETQAIDLGISRERTILAILKHIQTLPDERLAGIACILGVQVDGALRDVKPEIPAIPAAPSPTVAAAPMEPPEQDHKLNVTEAWDGRELTREMLAHFKKQS